MINQPSGLVDGRLSQGSKYCSKVTCSCEISPGLMIFVCLKEKKKFFFKSYFYYYFLKDLFTWWGMGAIENPLPNNHSFFTLAQSII